MFGYNKPQLMAIVFCHKERGISVEEENHLVTVGIVKKSKTILVLLASPIDYHARREIPILSPIGLQMNRFCAWVR